MNRIVTNQSNNIELPLVTIVCLCYNHAKYVEEALFSILNQTYKNIELFIVDDFSTDESQIVIKDFASRYKLENVILNSENIGNCKSFNKALKLAKGKYIIDLAADDLLLPNFVEKQVEHFEKFDCKTALVFCNVANVDDDRKLLSYFFPVNNNKKTIKDVKSGDIYRYIISGKPVINPVGMMMRKDILIEIGGYNEKSAFEDTDYWIRTSRKYHFQYNDMILCEKRKLRSSLGHRIQYKGNILLKSLINDYETALSLNIEGENVLMLSKVRRYLWQAIFVEDYESIPLYINLIKRISDKLDFISNLLIFIFFKFKIPIYWLYKIAISFRINLYNIKDKFIFPTKTIHLWQNSSDFSKRLLSEDELKGWSEF
jgi:glycosyltransferase involved in cell wall biosynthesis